MDPKTVAHAAGKFDQEPSPSAGQNCPGGPGPGLVARQSFRQPCELKLVDGALLTANLSSGA
jgi:hypothetical protein